MPNIALVTGGSRGLGRDMVLSLARQGNDVVLTYVNQPQAAQSVVEQVQRLGQKAVALPLNLEQIESLEGFVDDFKQTLQNQFNQSRFHYLINNAGIGIHAKFESTTIEQFDQLLNIHFRTPYFLTQKLLTVLVDGGSIVNISSGLTRLTSPTYSAYSSMKAAMENLTRYLAKDLGPRGIRVNTVAPGAVSTDFAGGLVRDNPTIHQTIAGLTALGRVGQADDIGAVVAFLCSEHAKWITAQRIEVSGGQGI